MTKTLFLFTLGPVQSFIFQARKTQDLYAGSYLLSHLADIAVKKTIELGGEIIFPDPHKRSIPNRLLAYFSESDNEKLKAIGQSIQGAVQHEFRTIANGVLASYSLEESTEFKEQIAQHLEFYWLFQPWGQLDYLENYRSIIAGLRTIKGTKIFEQITEAPGKKCSVSGEHNIVFYRKDRGGERGSTGSALPRSFPIRLMDDNEGLDAVNFIKRCLGPYFKEDFDSSFPSTARIALMEAGDRLKKERPDHQRIWKGVEELALFKLVENSSAEEKSDSLNKETIQAAALIKEHKIHCSPYYAIMLFDGDDMGKWYGEPHLKVGVSQYDFHSALSARMVDFADEVQRILIEPRGRVIYAGGEDFLGFININHLLKVMVELREWFGRLNIQEYTDDKPTFSAGIAIAHYKTPLSEVLKWAKKMEKWAKEIDTHKDAFGIAVLKHSGETQMTRLKWRSNDLWIPQLIERLMERVKKKDISTTFIKQLNQIFLKLFEWDGNTFDHADLIIKAEIKRLVGRSVTVEKLIGEDRERFENRRTDLVNVLTEDLSKLYFSCKNPVDFLSVLNIVTFLQREVI